MEDILIGSQLFINKSDTPDMVSNWVKQMDENKLRIIRLFMIWDQLEPQQGVWNFENYDVCFEEAEKRNMLVVPTLMAVSPPGWMLLTKGHQSVADIDDPNFWDTFAMAYVKKIAKRYSDSKALHSWILWNEPSRVIEKGKYSTPAFIEFLKEKYGNDIKKLNKKYYSQYDSFNDILKNVVVLTKKNIPFGSFVEQLDWIRFTVNNLNTKLKDIGNEIRKIDNQHPIHINSHGIGRSQLNNGQSIWKEAEFVDFLGCSAHPPWHSRRFPANRVHQSIAYFADLIKSATPDKEKLFWVTELQGGPTIYSSPIYSCPSAVDIEHWIWESIGSGARAVVFWCFNNRSYGNEGGEWGLLNQMGNPSPRLKAVKKAAEFIDEYRSILDKTRPAMGKVSLLCSEATWAIGEIDGNGVEVANPRNKFMGSDALAGAYLMCADLGLTVNIMDEKLLQSKRWFEDCKVLILPSVTSLEKDSINVIKEFVLSGGTVIADGLCGMKDEDGNIAYEYLKSLNEVFGGQVEEIEGVEVDFTVNPESPSARFAGWFVKVILKPQEGKTVARFDDGRVAVVANKTKNGQGVRIGTILFQRYLTVQSKESLQFFKELLPEDLFKISITLDNPSCTLRLRHLQHSEGEVLVLMNRGNGTCAQITAHEEGILEQIGGDSLEKVCIKLASGGKTQISIKSGEIYVFKWKIK